eukprot:scaffold2408_cov279-Chaetoceros_neogracile.AAC.23
MLKSTHYILLHWENVLILQKPSVKAFIALDYDYESTMEDDEEIDDSKNNNHESADSRMYSRIEILYNLQQKTNDLDC